ncbi:hypothetical protein BRARA_E00833 [Brassica rapa]|uniref:Polycomb protein VEFS-Box domain-containing protein n=1 Tax=Brassica campestris TaxID=3711 RepID=A0A397ZH75_BRACM|nr:hypothetical protein BRARA_E00833 [Brassica rapa]
MAGVRPLTEEDKEVISLYGKPITLYGILQAFTQDKPMTLEEVLSAADSDNENDKEFKDFQERMKIDRLVDASDDEKRFMVLWNTFMDDQSVYADKHVPWACEQFVKHHAKELITPELSWQWRMFAIDTLCIKYGLISPKTMDKCSIILQKAQLEVEFPEEAAAAAEVEALEEAEAAAKAAKAAADAAAAKASAAKGTRKSARIQKKKMQEAERALAMQHPLTSLSHHHSPLHFLGSKLKLHQLRNSESLAPLNGSTQERPADTFKNQRMKKNKENDLLITFHWAVANFYFT